MTFGASSFSKAKQENSLKFSGISTSKLQSNQTSICVAILLCCAANLATCSSIEFATRHSVRTKRAATARLDRLWDDALIPYEIDPVFGPDRAALFRSAMRHWENYTCIKFIERNPDEHRNYIVFTERSCGCCSFVGKRGNGPQAISIGRHCDKFGIVVHELGHVVGFWHEHTRPDRDQHVQIIGRNIMNGQEYNFNKLTKDEVNSLGLAYDYDSILHYATNTFAKETHLDTILPLHGYLNTEDTSPAANQNLTETRFVPSTSSNTRLPQANGTMINDEPQEEDKMKLQLQRDIQSMLDFPQATSSTRVKREIAIDVQNDEHMLAIDGFLAKTRPEIGQRVRLSVGDIAQTNLLYRCPKCGRTIQQAAGVFHSPTYFLAHEKRSSPETLAQFQGKDFCEWRLSVGLGERIMLNITDLDLAPPLDHTQTKSSIARFGLPRAAMSETELQDFLSTHTSFQMGDPMIMANCDRDYIEVRDGFTYRAPVLARLCGHIAGLGDLLRPIVSSSNRLLVLYRMSPTSVRTKRGFYAQHEALCGGVIILKETTYGQTPQHQNSYRTNSLGLMTSFFRYYPNGTSTSENEVPLNHQTSQRALGFQSQQPEFKISINNSNQTSARFKRANKESRAILVDQESLSRHGNPHQVVNKLPIINSSTFQSPNWPEAYRPGKECVWQVKAAINHRVALSFEAFDLEQHDSCAYDYIEIRDGENQDSDLIGRYCGQKQPNKVLSTSQSMFVKFVSDSDINRAGFVANLQSELDYCKLGLHDCSHQCLNLDYSYQCTCPEGLVLAMDGKSCLPLCGGIRNETFGKITSPNFPKMYPLNTRCFWEIKGSARQTVILNFSYFDLEGGKSKGCEYDFVDIRSRINENRYVDHGKICGTRQSFSVKSVSNEVVLEFVSDNTVAKGGFIVDFTVDENECANENGGCQHSCLNNFGSYQCLCDTGFLLNEDMRTCTELKCSHFIVAPEGIIRYPAAEAALSVANETSRLECSWTLSTMPGHRVQLTFEDFNLEPSFFHNCTNGNLAIYDGLSSNDLLLGRFCGGGGGNGASARPPSIVSSINSLYLNFQTPNLVPTGKFGFNATHSTVCGGRLQAVLNQNDLIYSHPEFDGASLYRSNENCEWLIESSINQRIKIDFTFLSLEYDNKCNYDHITIYDGPDEYSARKGRLCGSDVPKKHSGIISSGESMLIVFKSDDSINSRGFSLVYTAIESSEDELVAITDLKGTKYGQSS